MNIFVLDRDPVMAAMCLCDQHLSSQIKESAQILCMTVPEGSFPLQYKPFHDSPCVRWAKASRKNSMWLEIHAFAINLEYEKLYGRTHGSVHVLRSFSDFVDQKGHHHSRDQQTPFAQVMPDEYRCSDPVSAYRAYYRQVKSKFATWKTPRKIPSWWDQ